MIVETPQPSPSSAEDPWDWREHCEGFQVDGPEGRIGWVEALERDSSGQVVALLVRKHHVDRPVLRVQISAVVDVVAAHGRVVIDDPGLLRHFGVASRSTRREYLCQRCGYGARSAGAPAHCPMCGAHAWEIPDGGRGL